MPRGVYKRKRKLLPLDVHKPEEEKTNLATLINQLINHLIKLRTLING
jgi:hypothetical protein